LGIDAEYRSVVAGANIGRGIRRATIRIVQFGERWSWQS
jgi:hypothetical protein